jgi:hypothetical protein
MDTNQKLKVLNNNLTSILTSINFLETDIALNPTADIAEKPTRSSVLQDYIEKKAIIENMIATLNEEETL